MAQRARRGPGRVGIYAGAGLLLGLGGAGVSLAAARGVPWPYGAPPGVSAIEAQVQDALRIAIRERGDEWTSTKRRREGIEATEMLQSTLDEAHLPPDEIFIFGDEFFGSSFQRESGFAGMVSGPSLHRVHRGQAGGLDTFSCAGCHSVGGVDGAGTFGQNAMLLGDGDSASSTIGRNAPAVHGDGLIQALGVEMSAELQRAREEAAGRAVATQRAVTVPLQAKGVAFGQITVHEDGTADTSAVSGVDADLVVKPFGWKGDTARLRRMIEEASRVHFGVQSTVLEAAWRRQPDAARLGGGPEWYDPDHDGVSRELEEGTITATAVYLTLLETPQIVPPADPGLLGRWARGSAQLDALGCTDCHRRALHLDDRVWHESSDTSGAPPIEVNLLVEGEQPRGTDEVALFSDLRRHEMGPGLADAREHPAGVPRGVWLTRPLWELAETPPYLHDGRAPTIAAAILAHGGEAAAARDAYAALPPDARADLLVFLLSLSRAPRVRVVQ